jgi:hypothetical protein
VFLPSTSDLQPTQNRIPEHSNLSETDILKADKGLENIFYETENYNKMKNEWN